MKFCFKLDKSATETYKMLQKVYGETAVTKETVFKWFGRFREGNEFVEDDKRSKWSTIAAYNDENIVEIKIVILSV